MVQGSLGTPPGHCDGSANGQGVGVGLGLGLGLGLGDDDGDGEGDGVGKVPQEIRSIVWQTKGSTSFFGDAHSMESKTGVRQDASGLLQSAAPTLFCNGQFTQTRSRERVSLLQFTPSQQVSLNDERLVSNSEARKKFTGQISTGKLKASSFDNGPPGGASFHAKASVFIEGRQAAEPPSSGVVFGSAVAPVPM